jgi:hypothetical protein
MWSSTRRFQASLLGEDDRTANREYVRRLVLIPDAELGRKYGVPYAEQFHYIGPVESTIPEYIRNNAVPR